MDDLETIISNTQIFNRYINYDKCRECGLFVRSYDETYMRIYYDVTARIIYTNGLGLVKKFTIQHGLLHSFNDEPAEETIMENVEFEQAWYKNGLIHRNTGPANIYKQRINTYNYYFYLDGVIMYDVHEFINKVIVSDEEKIELVLKYG